IRSSVPACPPARRQEPADTIQPARVFREPGQLLWLSWTFSLASNIRGRCGQRCGQRTGELGQRDESCCQVPESSANNAPGLSLKLFGPLDIRVGGGPIEHLRTRRGYWLLALLALRQGRDVDREWLASTLWLDSPIEQALSSLRRTLTDLRSALGV